MLLIPFALAAPPSIDTPLRTGQTSPADAAVVIGIEHYPLLGRDVPYAEADAQAVANTFLYTRGIPLGRVLTLTENPTREDILAGVRDLGQQVGAGGTLFIFFAGHGAAAGKTRTLLGADVKATTDSFAANGVTTTELSSLGAAGGGRVVMLVDACFGGASRDGTDLLAGTRFVVPVDPDLGQWAATAENQVAAPLTEAGHGLFTYLAVGAMRGWADGELSGKRDGVVTADEAQAWMLSALRTMGRTSQTPTLASDLGGFRLTSGVKEAIDDTVLAGLRGRAPAPPVPAPDDYAAKLAALAKAQAEAEEAKRAHDAKVATAVSEKRGEATRAWAATKPIVAKGGDAGKAAAKLFVDAYGAVSVTVDGERTAVEIAELAEAKVALNATPTTTASTPLVDTGTPGFGDEVVTIPAGTFLMGTPTTEKDRRSDETQHRVTLSSFQMARTEVSQALWTKVMGKNPSETEYKGVSLVGDRLPVQNVSWCDVVDFANRLSRSQGLTEVYAGVSECEATKGVSVTMRSEATGWRLPTESEWEYAARAGTTGAWGAVTEESGVCGNGNVADASAKRRFPDWTWASSACDDGHDGLAPVGSYRANGWGLYDVTGNVREWAWDWYGEYRGTSETNPTGASSGSHRVIRGGSRDDVPADSRVGYRGGLWPVYRWSYLGVRLSRSLP